MSIGLHKVIKEQVEKVYFPPMSRAILDISYTGLSDRGKYKRDDVFKQMSEKLFALLNEGAFPTLNPVIDNILACDQNDGKNGLYLYIKDNHEIIDLSQVDNTKDAVKILTSIDILVINCLPFTEQESIIIEKAVVQTSILRKEIKE
jgi:hypothetical protein